MKTYLAIPIVAGLAIATLTMGGCVGQAEHDKVLAANRRVNEELMSTQEALQACRDEKGLLAARLDTSKVSWGAKGKEIALLERQKSELQRSFDSLTALYQQAKEQEIQPFPGVLLPATVNTALQGFARQNTELVEYLPSYGMLKFKSDFTFPKGSDDVSPSAAKALGKLASILNGSSAKKFHVYVAGHTDDIQITKQATKRRHPTNWYLSVHRAVEVQKALAKAGLNPKRIGAIGFGEYHPIAPNKPGKKGNAKNRRVEIWIVPPARLLTRPTEAGR